jgi:hypothetical protein
MLAGVIIASAPNDRTASAILSSSVATMTLSTSVAWSARSTTCRIIGFPHRSINGFAGSRVEPYRAGIIATMFGFLLATDQLRRLR